jgi:hypothetical protein
MVSSILHLVLLPIHLSCNMTLTAKDFLIITERESKSEDPAIKLALRRKIDAINKRRREKQLIHIRIKEWDDDGEYPFSMSADCMFPKYFNKQSYQLLHQWMLDNIGESYEEIKGTYFEYSDNDRNVCSTFIHFDFKTLKQAIDFSIVVSKVVAEHKLPLRYTNPPENLCPV